MPGAYAIVFVVDGADQERIEHAKQLLQQVLGVLHYFDMIIIVATLHHTDDRLVPHHAMILVVVNKMGPDESSLQPLDAIRQFDVTPLTAKHTDRAYLDWTFPGDVAAL